MDWQRNGLLAAIILVFGILFIQWNEFSAARKPPATSNDEGQIVIPAMEYTDNVNDALSAVPELEDTKEEVSAGSVMKPTDDRLVVVQTDVLEITIDTLGGDIVKVALLKYLVSDDRQSPPLVMLNRTSSNTYIAQSGLIGPNGTDTRGQRPLYRVSRNSFVMDDGDEEVTVSLKLTGQEATVTKQFILRRNNYLIDVVYNIENHLDTPWRAHLFGQIQRDSSNPDERSTMGPRPYLGMAITTDEENYKKLDFSDLDEESFKTEKTGGWVAMVQHYFVSAWVPDGESINLFQLRRLGQRDVYAAGFTGPATVIQAGQQGTTQASFYVGPKDQHKLASISPYLDLTIDYGWLWWVAKPLFAGLNYINLVLNNWGWSILILTVIVKLLFFPLSAASYRSMARMRKLQPEMLRMRELYADDRQKLSQEMMGLYKKEKVNPVGGCFPMLIQMPVFIALYWVLNESVELRHAPWILWISDLSQKDPFYVLPVLNGLSMYVLQTLQPAPPDPIQAKVMKIMPVAFSFFFMFFPSGLVLYWTANSMLSIAQQWTITKKIIGE